MNKTILTIICIVIVILSILGNKYLNYKDQKRQIDEDNLEYEIYLNKDVSGRDLATTVNRAVDNNEKNKVSKDDFGFYVQNDINSVLIEIKISDNDTTYKMETLYNGGMATFIQYYLSAINSNSLLLNLSPVHNLHRASPVYSLFITSTNNYFQRFMTHKRDF